MFFENFERVCTIRGTTPTAVCKSLGMSTSGVTSWKRGSHPRADILARLADHLGVSVSDLLGDTDPAAPALTPPPFLLSVDEQALIEAYRSDPALRAAIDAVLVAAGHKKKAQDAESLA